MGYWQGYQSAADVADSIVTSVSAADVTVVASSPFSSDTVSVRANWPGSATTVRWNNALIQAGQIVHVTPATTRIRVGFTAVAAGFVDISRSSGSVNDEQFVATIGGVA